MGRPALPNELPAGAECLSLLACLPRLPALPAVKIMRKFGEGTFGRVVECWDRQRRGYVAVKIIRNIQVRRSNLGAGWKLGKTTLGQDILALSVYSKAQQQSACAACLAFTHPCAPTTLISPCRICPSPS